MRTTPLALLLVTGCGNDVGVDANNPNIDAATSSGPPGSPMVVVGAPRANEAYYQTQSITITWTATDDNSSTVACDVAAVASTRIAVAAGIMATSGQPAMTSWALATVAPATYRIEVACADANNLVGTGISGSFVVSGPPQQVSYSSQIQPLWTSGCTSLQCHDAQAPAAALNLTAGASYAELYDVNSGDCTTTKLVKPGAPDQSYLVHKLQGSGPCFIGTRMPKGAPAFSTQQLQLVRDWIANGAPNN